MTLKQLRYLIAIAEAGSFSSAARRAYIAQPALSRQINLLESELELQLLERVHDGVNLTDAGRRLYEIARSVIQTIDSVKDELESTKGNPKGRVAIAIPVTASALLLPLIITRAKEKFPSIELTVRDGLSQEGGEAIELGSVDFGLVPNAEELEHVHVEPVFTEELYWLSVQAANYANDSITLAQALSAPLVMAPRASSHLRRRVEQAAVETGLELKIQYEQQTAQGVSSLVRSGLAATIGNWPAVEENPQKMARRIVEPSVRRTLSIAYSTHKPLSFPASCIRDLVRALLIEVVQSGRWKGELIERQQDPQEV
ncbi:LysR family transcriptional regulator [Pseudomonas plecoglossicida]|uniref:LysR family transcriptional regulator n=1 Tax=Pseudomonas plecoglossicida TaxID=70775 RepID=A0AAD0R0S2_PSEDL|nr:LysR family transcriptional regulator [Pseudomonas plecoglossicida]AXM98027.1 LysR family transcriptional regulator [Pseudomonas plecoglossicida]EPB96045.1 LysR family transcriptional regulator [Pseudomonas plecoglossicida NB2011]QLB54167.1 LysR family transcriptional regulator [Pseudomonas plecoglossicida]